MSREPTDAMLKAGQEAYARKLADMSSPYPTEEPGIGPLGYAYIAMHDADPERDDAARLAAHCQSLIDVIDNVQDVCGAPIADEDMEMVRHIETVAEAALYALSAPAPSIDAEAVETATLKERLRAATVARSAARKALEQGFSNLIPDKVFDAVHEASGEALAPDTAARRRDDEQAS